MVLIEKTLRSADDSVLYGVRFCFNEKNLKMLAQQSSDDSSLAFVIGESIAKDVNPALVMSDLVAE